MSMIFGHKWTSSYGDMDDGTWQTGLAGLDIHQIKHGLNVVKESGNEWPPSLPEFRAMCKATKGHPSFKEFPPALPPPEVDPEYVESLLGEMRAKLDE